MFTDRTIQLHAAILQLFHDAISHFPPDHAPYVPAQTAQSEGRLGDYLVQLGYLTPRQLGRALQDGVRTLAHRPLPLGCRLVAQQLVPAQVVSAILLQQFLDRLTNEQQQRVRFLGEQLLIDTQIEPIQLAIALQDQIVVAQRGPWVRLGDVIVQHGWLDAPTITDVAQHMPHIDYP